MLDSSVVIALFRPVDTHHHATRAELTSTWEREDDFVLVASVLSECMVGAYRDGDAVTLRERIVSLFGPVRPIDEELALAAAQLRARRPALRLPDALVIATGIVEDASVMTCDKRLAAVDERVRVISAA